MRRQLSMRVTSVPRNFTLPFSGNAKPEIALKNVVFPAPFGPISAWIVPSRTFSDTSSTARTPPKTFEMPVASSRIRSDMRVVVRELLRCAAPQRLKRAEDPAREAEHAYDEQRAQEDLPPLSDRRDDVLADHVDERADERAPHGPRTAEDHREHEVSGLVPVQFQRVREVDQQAEQRPAQPRHRRGDQQRDEDEPIGVEPEVAHARLVLPDRDQRAPERRANDRAKREQRDDEDHERSVIEAEVGHGDVRRGEPSVRPRDLHQTEVDAAAAQQKRSEDQPAEQRRDHPDQHRLDEVNVPVRYRQRRAVRAEAEVRRVPECGQARVSQQQVDAHHRDCSDEHFAHDRNVQMEQRRKPRAEREQHDDGRRDEQLLACGHPKMPSSPKSPRGRTSSTIAMSTYIATSLAAGMNSVVIEIAMPTSSPPTMLPNRVPLPPIRR